MDLRADRVRHTLDFATSTFCPLELLTRSSLETNFATARQKVKVKQGIEQSVAKKIVAAIKGAKLKVETQINGDRLRVTDTKKDDLQFAIALVRKTELDVSLQFDNFRD